MLVGTERSGEWHPVGILAACPLPYHAQIEDNPCRGFAVIPQEQRQIQIGGVSPIQYSSALSTNGVGYLGFPAGYRVLGPQRQNLPRGCVGTKTLGRRMCFFKRSAFRIFFRSGKAKSDSDQKLLEVKPRTSSCQASSPAL